jgi:hypothetical protein
MAQHPPFTPETARAAIQKRWANHRKPRWEARKLQHVPIEEELALLDNAIPCECQQLYRGHWQTCPKIVERGLPLNMIHEARVRNRKEATQVEGPKKDLKNLPPPRE